MKKPQSYGDYSQILTHDCERVLVTLFSGLGPWRNSVFLVGGLTPRYLVKARPPKVPPHAGTGDIDVVMDFSILADTSAYRTLEQNLKKMGFERAENEQGAKVSWRWKVKTDSGTTVILEFLADAPDAHGGALQELPTEGNVSAINIPHASIVFDMHERVEITADLLGENGRATESIPFADIVSFVCLKAFAFDQRRERKDAHDLIYCLNHHDGGIEETAEKFRTALEGAHSAVVKDALRILLTRFCDPKPEESYLREGPVAVALFEIDGDDPQVRDRRTLRQRDVSELMHNFLNTLGITF